MSSERSSNLTKKSVSYSNIIIGSVLNLFEVSTLGQPFEVIKTHMAANRKDSIATSFRKIWKRGHILGFYQGLIPWAYIEASTKGAVLLFTASEIEYHAQALGADSFVAGMLGGMFGGIAQAYITVGFCTFMKTVEITRNKYIKEGIKIPSTYKIFIDKYRKEGIRGINRGANAVALRQMTNWGSRIGFTRLIESKIKMIKNKDNSEQLSPIEKVICSSIAGGLSCWNQPIEVIRIEMQSAKNDPNRPPKLNVISTFRYIYKENGIRGLYRGVSPRICLGIWQTITMVALGDIAKQYMKKFTNQIPVNIH
ncbi:hypothetical protein MERGE_001533 [Pneumocystis wakefieldiae]|uniref:Mitochondrial DNA replication protein YHM2 n=1 Tax=Pneumocystis wakefieldiae TaxID=38082 RepID=A0A899G3I6_9ASCO|nr:hypothetical protein MERGE_001533 [Pneumocystis wakefieldiae]